MLLLEEGFDSETPISSGNCSSVIELTFTTSTLLGEAEQHVEKKRVQLQNQSSR